LRAFVDRLFEEDEQPPHADVLPDRLQQVHNPVGASLLLAEPRRSDNQRRVALAKGVPWSFDYRSGHPERSRGVVFR
jgi:hypothetical protein